MDVGGVTCPVDLLAVGVVLDGEGEVEAADGCLDDELVVVVFLECSDEEEGGCGVGIHEDSKVLRGTQEE